MVDGVGAYSFVSSSRLFAAALFGCEAWIFVPLVIEIKRGMRQGKFGDERRKSIVCRAEFPLGLRKHSPENAPESTNARPRAGHSVGCGRVCDPAKIRFDQ
jgi:hypothetical protein